MKMMKKKIKRKSDNHIIHTEGEVWCIINAFSQLFIIENIERIKCFDFYEIYETKKNFSLFRFDSISFENIIIILPM